MADLIEIARGLVRLGYNVIPVGPDKSPTCIGEYGQFYDQRMPEDAWGSVISLDCVRKKATGLGLLGSINPAYPDKKLVIIDVDDPRKWREEVLPNLPGSVRERLEGTWKWLTGPRCSVDGDKHGIECRGSKCRHGEHEFELSGDYRGIAYAVLVPRDCEPRKYKFLDGAVELRLRGYELIPPSRHPSGVQYEWVNQPIGSDGLFHPPVELTCEEFRQLINALEGGAAGKPGVEEAGEERPRVLSDDKLLRLKELIKPAYRPGARHDLVLSLSGWCAKARVHPISCIKLVKMLIDETQDKEARDRLSAVIYSYKKAGINIDEFAREIEELTGVKPYGLEKEIPQERVRGKSGVQEILESVLGEERALAIINEIQEILGSASPYSGDSVIALLDYEKQLYAVNNISRKVIVRAVRTDNGFRYKERVVAAAITNVVVYDDPINGIRKYTVTLEGDSLKEPKTIEGVTIEELIARLRLLNLVLNKRLVDDVVAAVLDAFITRGRAEVRREVDADGFFLINNELVIHGFTPECIEEETRKALEFLNELGSKWFGDMADKFATAVKWGAAAPFSYVAKQLSYYYRGMFLVGPPGTGKTTLGKIPLSMWGVATPGEGLSGANVDTVARLGEVLRRGTFPVLINEAGALLENDSVYEMIKNAIESTIARGKVMYGQYTLIPALAPLVLTANDSKTIARVASDYAILRRFYVLVTRVGEVRKIALKEEFEKSIRPRIENNELSPIGRCIAAEVIGLFRANGPDLFRREPLELGEILLGRVYQRVGLEPPAWLRLKAVESEEKTQEEVIEAGRERFLAAFINYINRLYTNNAKVIEAGGYSTTLQTVADRLDALLRVQAIPGMYLKKSRDKGIEEVVITREFLNQIQMSDINLPSLEDLFKDYDWRYTEVKISGRVIRGVVVPLEKLKNSLEDLFNEEMSE